MTNQRASYVPQIDSAKDGFQTTFYAYALTYAYLESKFALRIQLGSDWNLFKSSEDKTKMKDLESKMKEIETEREILEKQILNLIMKIDHKVDQIEGTWYFNYIFRQKFVFSAFLLQKLQNLGRKLVSKCLFLSNKSQIWSQYE